MTHMMMHGLGDCPDECYDRAAAYARELADQKLIAWAEEEFPGLTDLTKVHVRTKTFITDEPLTYVGRWHDVLLELSTWNDGRNAAHPVAVCDCCGYHVTTGGRSVFSVAEYAYAYPTRPKRTTAECFACSWLHPAQDEAKTRTSALSQWLFKFTRQHSVQDVLAEHSRAA